MTDTPAPTLANFTPEQVNSMTPEIRGSFARQLAASGFDKGQIEKTFGAGSLAPPAPPPAPEITPASASADTVAMAARLKEHWTGDQAALNAALKNAGVEDKPDTRTDAEKGFDAGFAKPENGDYRLNFTGRTLGDPVAVKNLDGQYKKLFTDIALPSQAAQGMLDTLLDSAAQFRNLKTDAEKGLYKQGQKVLLSRLGGDIGDLQTIVSFAAKALSGADQAFIKQLTDSGAFESAGAIMHLARQWQRLEHRKRLASAS